MNRGRKKTFPAIARLSRAALDIVERAFLAGPGVRSVKSIVEEIKKQTDETLDDNAIYRYREYWLSEERPFIEARKRAEGMLAALKDSPTDDLEELVKQQLIVAQINAGKDLDKADPIELGYLAATEKRVEIQRERNKLLRERTENDKKKIAILERSVAMKEKTLERVKQNAEKVKGALAAGVKPERVVEMVDKILGL
jgi:nucleoside 2-deoxyribosyltransferase